MISKQKSLAVESGAIFVEIAAEHIVDGAVKFADQIVDAKPLSAGDDAPILQVCPEDVNGVLEWCVENTESGFSGNERPDLRALITLAKRLERVDLFADLLVSHSEVEDAMLAALCASISEGSEAAIWKSRVTEILTLKNN